jgi:hypothetical protein
MVTVPFVALASRIAWRNEPGPLSFTLVTVRVTAEAKRTEQAKGPQQNKASRVKLLRGIFLSQGTDFETKRGMKLYTPGKPIDVREGGRLLF